MKFTDPGLETSPATTGKGYERTYEDLLTQIEPKVTVPFPSGQNTSIVALTPGSITKSLRYELVDDRGNPVADAVWGNSVFGPGKQIVAFSAVAQGTAFVIPTDFSNPSPSADILPLELFMFRQYQRKVYIHFVTDGSHPSGFDASTIGAVMSRVGSIWQQVNIAFTVVPDGTPLRVDFNTAPAVLTQTGRNPAQAEMENLVPSSDFHVFLIYQLSFSDSNVALAKTTFKTCDGIGADVPNGFSYVPTRDSSGRAYSQSEVATLIGHELGHALGLNPNMATFSTNLWPINSDTKNPAFNYELMYYQPLSTGAGITITPAQRACIGGGL